MYPLNDYTIVLPCKSHMKLFGLMRALAPMLKIFSLMAIIAGIFNHYWFIAAALLFLVSVAINYIKWYLVYNYVYVLKDGTLTIKKSYTYIKHRYLLRVKIKDITCCQLINEDKLQEETRAQKLYCLNEKYDVYIKIEANKQMYILLADNYFYSLLQKEAK
ncbi:MAG: hypothetical protein ACOYEC_00135 [Christensenellales bacterium]|nr:hypothetical protein [Clostridiales bacterium]